MPRELPSICPPQPVRPRWRSRTNNKREIKHLPRRCRTLPPRTFPPLPLLTRSRLHHSIPTCQRTSSRRQRTILSLKPINNIPRDPPLRHFPRLQRFDLIDTSLLRCPLPALKVSVRRRRASLTVQISIPGKNPGSLATLPSLT